MAVQQYWALAMACDSMTESFSFLTLSVVAPFKQFWTMDKVPNKETASVRTGILPSEKMTVFLIILLKRWLFLFDLTFQVRTEYPGALRYKLEGSGFDSRRYHYDFSLT
jgi:hypothetical protein